MSENNTGLFHYFFFAIAAVVLVYAGEQVKCHPDAVATCLMKFTAAEAAISIMAMGLSFIPASLNEGYEIKKVRSEGIVEHWFIFDGQPLNSISREYARLIQQESIQTGKYEALQNVYHKWTVAFNAAAWTLLLLAAGMFAVGVCVL